MGMNLSSMSKILKYVNVKHMNCNHVVTRCAANDDIITVKAQDQADTPTFMFESTSASRRQTTPPSSRCPPPSSRGSSGNGPSPLHMATFPSCRDLSQLGESVVIACTKSSSPPRATSGPGNIKLVQTANVDKEEEAVIIEMQEPVAITFACRYLGPLTVRTCR